MNQGPPNSNKSLLMTIFDKLKNEPFALIVVRQVRSAVVRDVRPILAFRTLHYFGKMPFALCTVRSKIFEK